MKKCTCKIPEPKMKNSENGINVYCEKCLLEFDNNLTNKKQTAVEFLIESVMARYLYTKEMLEEFEQAKEMEKEQIIDAYLSGYSASENLGDSEQYYKETYGNK